MHAEARAFVERIVAEYGPWDSVVEFGSRDVNGSIRDLFSAASRYVGVDLQSGPGVDVVCDAADYAGTADCLVSCEMLEHTPHLAGFAARAARVVNPGGALILTCATETRAPHGCDGAELRDGEFYSNVHPGHMSLLLSDAFDVRECEVHDARGDFYWFGVRRDG